MDRLPATARTLESIVAVVLAVLLSGVGRSDDAIPASPQQQAPAIQPRQPQATQPQVQGDESTLVLPKLEGPRLAPAPPAIESPNIPSVFQGCWEGVPDGFDWVDTDPGLVAVGSPGKITFCYSEHEVTVPQTEVRISAGGHALDLFAHLALGFSTFTAHGISTDAYAITPTRMRGRTNLVVIHTDHWLYVIIAGMTWP